MADLDVLVRQLQGALGRIEEIRFGTAVGTWPGGTPRASDTVVAHGCRATPLVLAALRTGPNATWFPVVAAFGETATVFTHTATTSDGSSPAVGTPYTIAWVAVVVGS